VEWLERNAGGVSWGIMRCEKWGKGRASLHAEGRAVDWHLDSARPADRREARRLIDLLLATDAAGNPHALARRMGIQEIIWNCRSWWSGGDHPLRALLGGRAEARLLLAGRHRLAVSPLRSAP
jgi:hypothetical protein